MAQLIVLVLNNPGKLGEIMTAWLSVDVPGITTMESSGLRQHNAKHRFRDDLPLFPSLDDLLGSNDEHSVVVFAIVPDGFDMDELVTATEPITGPLDTPDTGILFTLPVGRVWGTRRV